MMPATQLEAFPLDKNERYTPRKLFDPLDAEFRFTLDACATRESAKCQRYFTRAQDGLHQSWEGERVFCNPPWSDIEPWVAKAWKETEAERVVMLLPAWTDRAWWHRLVEPYRDSRSNHQGRHVTTRFLRGRKSFGSPGDPEGKLAGSPNFWLVILVWSRL